MWKFSAGDFARWPPEVTSNLIYCVILINIHSKLEEFLVVNVWGSSTAFPLLNHSHSEQFFFWIAVIIPLAADRDCCLSCFHCVPLRRVCLCFLYKFPLGPWRQQLDLFSLPFSRLNNLCSLHTSHNYSPWTFMLSHCCSLSYCVESFIPICSCARLDFLLTPFWPFILPDTAHFFSAHVTGFLVSWSPWQNFLPPGCMNSLPQARINGY